MHEIVAVWLIAAIGALQSLSALPRLGSVGKELTGEDLDELARLVSTSGRRPWLLLADETFLPGPRAWYVFVYLEPDVVKASLRRGPIQVAVAKDKIWHLRRSALWAQVAVAGRTFEQIAGERDLNRPFEIFGELTDEEILTAILFIRTSPKNPTPPPPLPGRTEPASILTEVKGNWPVSRMVRREDGTVQIDLLEYEHSGQTVTLNSAHGKWEIRHVGSWISG